MKVAGREQKTDLRGRLNSWRRRGAAAVELAVVTPVLLLTAMGIVDVGQYVSVGQTINNASREGARVAVRSDTTSVSQIEAAVLAYMCDALPGVSEDTIDNALDVEVAYMDGEYYYYYLYGESDPEVIPGGDLTTINPTDDSDDVMILVTVTFDYQNVRWAPTSFFGASVTIPSTTIMRRDYSPT